MFLELVALEQVMNNIISHWSAPVYKSSRTLGWAFGLRIDYTSRSNVGRHSPHKGFTHDHESIESHRLRYLVVVRKATTLKFSFTICWKYMYAISPALCCWNAWCAPGPQFCVIDIIPFTEQPLLLVELAQILFLDSPGLPIQHWCATDQMVHQIVMPNLARSSVREWRMAIPK